ncbi:MAG: response regulator transcription factor [Clostridia bacterium]|nr:response regulator transcription factor [Clostridia bacterium]
MSKFLIADDEEGIRQIIKEYCEFEGYTTDFAADGMDAVKKAKETDYDMIIMDAMMPKLDGFSATKEIRKNKQTPIIMLSARVEEYDKLHAFEMGVDDYVTKPFSPKELMARSAAIMRRGAMSEDKMVCGELTIDFAGCAVFISGKRVPMTPKECELLFLLARYNGKAFSRQELLDKIWGFDYYGDERTVDTHIKMLRKSLGNDYRDKIVTVRGMGYKAVL